MHFDTGKIRWYMLKQTFTHAFKGIHFALLMLSWLYALVAHLSVAFLQELRQECGLLLHTSTSSTRDKTQPQATPGPIQSANSAQQTDSTPLADSTTVTASSRASLKMPTLGPAQRALDVLCKAQCEVIEAVHTMRESLATATKQTPQAHSIFSAPDGTPTSSSKRDIAVPATSPTTHAASTALSIADSTEVSAKRVSSTVDSTDSADSTPSAADSALSTRPRRAWTPSHQFLDKLRTDEVFSPKRKKAHKMSTSHTTSGTPPAAPSVSSHGSQTHTSVHAAQSASNGGAMSANGATRATGTSHQSTEQPVTEPTSSKASVSTPTTQSQRTLQLDTSSSQVPPHNLSSTPNTIPSTQSASC
eukprot:m.26042 g.26042  ORF g.26042 m.26042 type:complete len:361 (+) comp8783_c0_seq2:22-1104(+)